MSTKAIEEKLNATKAPGEAVRRPRPEAVIPDAAKDGKQHTRVNDKVVRRRKQGDEKGDLPEPVVVAEPARGGRRTAVAPPRAQEVVVRAQVREEPVVARPVIRDEQDLPPVVVEAAPPAAEIPAEMPQVDRVEEPVAEVAVAVEPPAEPVAAVAVEVTSAPAVVEAPVVEPVAVVIAAPVVAAAPAVAPEPAPRDRRPPPPGHRQQQARPPVQRAVRVTEGESRATVPESRTTLPETARFAGLGKAVVALPPGYDPSNPGGNRGVVGGRRAATPAPAAAPPPRGGRRQVEPVVPAPEPQDNRGDRRPRPGKRTEAPVPAAGRKPALPPKRPQVPGTIAPKAAKRKVRIDGVVSVSQLSHELGQKAPVVLKILMKMGMLVKVNDMLDLDTATLVAAEFDYEVENVGFTEDKFLQHVSASEDQGRMVSRAPVVTIMGHVDHGKTTLLDAIRNASVAKGEAGGITQHIGAYQVEHNDHTITFIDTPGHAAFSSMRARGAQVTDIVILVVAADDGVQPQTREAIAHARAAKVPIIVAVNKMDKPGVKSDPIKQQLTELGLQPEDWGGETLFCEVSALKKIGMGDILEAVLLQAEMLDLKANAERHAEGIVIESQMEKGKGAVATVLVQSGTLHVGDFLVIGTTFGKVRAMTDFRGKKLKEAGPSVPVSITGLGDLPDAGDTMVVVENDKNARTLAEHRGEQRRMEALGIGKRRTMEDLIAQAGQSATVVLNVLVKADVNGSVEAVKGAVLGLEVPGTEVRVLLAGVGDISESDVNLIGANISTSHTMLLGFNVKADAKAREACEKYGIEPQIYSVIYTLLDDVKRKMASLLDPDLVEVRHGMAEIRQTFSISKVGTIAGCMVKEGKIGRNHTIRLSRGGKKVWEGRIVTLKRFKDDVREVEAGFECGVRFDGFNDVQEGDVFESFSMEQVKAE